MINISINELNKNTITEFVRINSDGKPCNKIIKIGKDSQGKEFLELKNKGFWTWIAIYIFKSENYKLQAVNNYVEKNKLCLDQNSIYTFLKLLEGKTQKYNKKRPISKHIKGAFGNASYSGAATKISRVVWKARLLRKRGIEPVTSLSLYFIIKNSIYEKSDSELYAEEYQKKIEEIFNQAEYAEDPAILRWLAYSLFSGINGTRFYAAFTESDPILVVLDPSFKGSRKEALAVIKETFENAKADWNQRKPSKRVVEDPEESKKLLDEELEKPSWCKFVKRDEDEKITIHHGGGLFYIKNFLKGKATGYDVISPDLRGRGMFVSPGSNTRVAYYAKRTSLKLDIPASFTGEIEARHLGKVPNKYEAILRKEKVQELKNIVVEVIS